MPPQPLPKNDHDDDRTIVAAWIICEKDPDSPDRNRYFWAWQRIYELCRADPARAWRLILEILKTDTSREIIQNLSAGPLEDLLSEHPYTAIEWVEAEAKANPMFAALLGGVWQLTMPPAVWEQVKAVRDVSSWGDARD